MRISILKESREAFEEAIAFLQGMRMDDKWDKGVYLYGTLRTIYGIVGERGMAWSNFKERRISGVFSQGMQEAIAQWKHSAINPKDQLDRRWVERYRELASYDGHWWLTPAGSFTEEEQAQCEQLSDQGGEDATREALSSILVQSRERELASAFAEQRQPRLFYPAIDIADVRRRITGLLHLDYEIAREESNELVRVLYQGTIEEEVDYLRLIEACYEGNSERFWYFNQRSDPQPTTEEMSMALAYLKRELLRGLKCPGAREASEHVITLLRDQFHLPFDLSEAEAEQQNLLSNGSSAFIGQTVTAQTAQRFFEVVLRESGYEEWRVVIDSGASNARIEQGLRTVFLPAQNLPLKRIKHLLAHELAGHVSRCVAGTYSPIGLLGIHTQHSLPTDEGLAIWYERQAAAGREEAFDDWIIWVGALAVGFACGVLTPPQTFLSLFPFFEALYLCNRLVEGWDKTGAQAHKRAQRAALTRCLRTFRGVPDLERVGICYTKDVVYLRGVRQIECVVAENETLLDRLTVGVIAPEHVPLLQTLALTPPPQPLRELALDPGLDSYIRSFEQTGEKEAGE